MIIKKLNRQMTYHYEKKRLSCQDDIDGCPN